MGQGKWDLKRRTEQVKVITGEREYPSLRYEVQSRPALWADVGGRSSRERREGEDREYRSRGCKGEVEETDKGSKREHVSFLGEE
jgi:hypothetical protein